MGILDDTPITAVKAVLSEMIKALGGEAIMMMLQQMGLSTSTLIFM